MSISPFLRTPITDLTGGLMSHQLLGRCQKEEMRYMDCMEAYGMDRGLTKCKAVFDEFHECHTLTKQFKRFFLLGRCAEMEMDMADCLEAYGLDRGLRKCKDIIEDFRECHTLTKQFKRFEAMRKERDKQIAEGKLKGDKMYVSPRIDGF